MFPAEGAVKNGIFSEYRAVSCSAFPTAGAGKYGIFSEDRAVSVSGFPAGGDGLERNIF